MKLLDKIRYNYQSLERWVAYRTYEKHHELSSGLSPAYYDVDVVMVETLFKTIEDFVEVHQATFSTEFEQWQKNPLTRVRNCSLLKLFFANEFRNGEYGSRHVKEQLAEYKSMLEEAVLESDGEYSKNYMLNIKHNIKLYTTLIELYDYIKLTRQEKEVKDEVGFSQYTQYLRTKYSRKSIYRSPCGTTRPHFIGSDFEEKKYKELLELVVKETIRRKKLQTKMLIKIIEIRDCLWR